MHGPNSHNVQLKPPCEPVIRELEQIALQGKNEKKKKKKTVPVDTLEITLKLTLLCLHGENQNRKYLLQSSEQKQGAH